MYPQPEIQSRDIRMTLPQRYGPYWREMSFHRHLGYHKQGVVAYWVARYRTKAQSYRRKRIGIADDTESADGKAILTHEQALERARAWFDHPKQYKLAAPLWRIDSSRNLLFCPLGDEFTIGHAIYDFVEWKRLVATKDHFATLLCIINRYIVPQLASLRVNELTAEVIRQFIRRVIETPPKRGNQLLGPSVAFDELDEEALRKKKKTVNTLLSYVRTALRMAWENEKIDNDRIWRRIGRFRRVDRPRMLHLSREECRKLLLACRPDLRELVLGALYTGCRAIELCRMRCSHVGRDGYGVYVPPSKTHRPRFIFLPDEGMAWFLSLVKDRRPGEHVFVTRFGKYWRGTTHNLLFKEAVRSAGLPDEFAFHGLRHTYASQLVQAGAPVFAIADQLGHGNPMTVLRTYGHLSPQIRESEVRQRFTTLDRANARAASTQARRLRKWRSSLHGADWRTYAKITDLGSRSKNEEDGDLTSPTNAQLGDFESVGYLF